MAYHGLVAQFFTGPELLASVNNHYHLNDVIDLVTTALGLPIAGLKMLHMEGTLGFYFLLMVTGHMTYHRVYISVMYRTTP